MDTESRFTNYYDNVTTLHPLAGAMLLVAAIATFVLPRRHVFFPVILLTVLVPAAQRLVILGLDFHFLRLMTLAGWIRVLARGEYRPLRMTPLDWAMVAWTIARLVAVVLRRGSPGALVNQLGQGFDALGIYLLARVYVRSWRDVDGLVSCFIWASLPVLFFSIYEVLTHRNPFYIFDPSLEHALVRDGRVRARGAFSHQILAGCYWVGVLPLMAGRFFQKRRRLTSSIGIAASIVLIFNCASSTPLLGSGLALVGAAFWPLRRRMSAVRWSLLGVLVLVQLSMSKPIWHLIHRAGALGLGASTGYHRYRLIQAFVDNFKKWALVGVNGTGSWGRQLEDVTNHFIVQGVKGGLVTFVLFIAVYVLAFRQVGWILRASARSRSLSIWGWALGVSLLAHSAMMFATSYFGQILLPWYLTFGVVGSLSSVAVAQRRGRSSEARTARGKRPPRGGLPQRGRRRPASKPSGRRIPGRLADLLR